MKTKTVNSTELVYEPVEKSISIQLYIADLGQHEEYYIDKEDAIKRKRMMELLEDAYYFDLNGDELVSFYAESKYDIECFFFDYESKEYYLKNNHQVYCRTLRQEDKIKQLEFPCNVVFLIEQDDDSFDEDFYLVLDRNIAEEVKNKIREYENIYMKLKGDK